MPEYIFWKFWFPVPARSRFFEKFWFPVPARFPRERSREGARLLSSRSRRSLPRTYAYRRWTAIMDRLLKTSITKFFKLFLICGTVDGILHTVTYLMKHTLCCIQTMNSSDICVDLFWPLSYFIWKWIYFLCTTLQIHIMLEHVMI